MIFRHVARLTTNLKLSVWLSDGRTAIYFITYIVWGILLRRHVVVRSVKRWLSAIVFLMLFWMIVRQIPKTKIPWYWDGEVYVPKDTEPVQVGNFTVEAEYLPIDTVYPTFNNGYSKVAKSGGIMYLQMETLASTVMKMEDSHMKEMSILILMLKISLETKMEICMHLEMVDRLFDGVQKRMKCCLITA